MILTFLILSLIINCILFWYVRKLVQQLNFGLTYTQELQNLLEEYADGLENMLELEMYYGDDTMTAAVKNTRMVIETCKIFEKSVLKKGNDAAEDNEPEPAEG